MRGREGLAGQERREALPALLLLLVFAIVVPGLGERTRPVEDTLDCSRVAVDDAAALERCVEVRPNDVDLTADLGSAYERSSQSNRAEELYRRALTIDPEDGDVRVRLAELLLRKGDAEGARREATAALALQPGREPAQSVIRRATDAEAPR